VGGGEGPDLRRLADIIARAGRRSVYAAGGVRDRADVEALRKVGAAGVLVASALHTNAIRAGDLQAIAGR
jgi:phosphoribosylformimino-5-aminoimidazole carboxamide ribotide isomerase